MSASGSSITYGYNADGKRISKTANGTTYNYAYLGDQLTEMTWGSNKLHFTYDSIGPASVTYNGNRYFYLKNAQGDVTGLVNASGTQVVSYTYDPWGAPMSVSGSMSATLGAVNPLRYRGYVYDTETGLYYLSSRYYNPVWGRFINADTADVLGASPDKANWDKNLFAYCDNAPVNRKDDGGDFWNIVAGAVIGGGLELVGQLLSGKTFAEVNWAKVGVSAVSGGLTAAVGPVAGCLISGATDVAMDALDGNINSVVDAVKSFAWGAAKAAASYGVGRLIGKATNSLTKIQKIGKMGNDGYPGVKYSYNKGTNRVVRSIELHPSHNGHGIHLQGNKWNPRTGTRSGVFFRKTLWR